MSVSPFPPSISPNPPWQDTPLNLPRTPLPTPTQAMALLATGLAAGAAVPMPTRSPSSHAAQEMRSDVSKILFLFNKLPYSLGNLFEKKPEFRAPLAVYALVAGVGVLGASALQGVQEAWVRLEESQIRAQLVGRLTRVFAQSIHLKQQSDARLTQQTEQQLAALVAQQRMSQPWQWVHCAQAVSHGFSASHANANPQIPTASDALFPYQPTHRGLTLMPAGFGNTAPARFSPSPLNLSTPETGSSALGWAIGGALLGTGFLTGLILKSVLGVTGMPSQLSGHPAGLGMQPLAKSREFEDAVTIDNLEAVVTAKAHLGDWQGMAGMLATGSLLGTSKLAIDGLRQVAVTRANADTEYRYQSTNWLSLDPAFHAVAESTAVQQQLGQFAAGLPTAKAYPSVVVNQMARILGGIGYNSAPKYFLMTPPVGLVDARG